METATAETEDRVLEDKIENLIAIGAATAANCIPCFEHLYEKAINSGITLAEIKRASDNCRECESQIVSSPQEIKNYP